MQGANGLANAMSGLLSGGPIAPPGAVQNLVNAAAGSGATWGLTLTKAGTSSLTGRGIKVAILDTGLDLNHPDFPDGRVRDTTFFITDSVQDRHSRGTHCTGISCGPRTTQDGRRYGVACEADTCEPRRGILTFPMDVVGGGHSYA
jgi:subtilisin